MTRCLTAFLVGLVFTGPSFAQVTFSDYGQYCEVMSEASSTTLVARTQGMPKTDALALMNGMTDPLAIRLINEVIK